MKTMTLRLGHPDGRFNLRISPGRLWPALLLMAACAALALISLRAGALQLSIEQVWAALQGHGSRLNVAVVQQWRLPRVAMALAIGAALA
ncbi:Ferric enterobactin transport system permease protein fepG [Chromobacterium violaceum]|uniref:Ferric enterobactin transport system permease protein fepG n=1 Tax=Chromobacterium violaceum TaxID=536 RepID=A0A3S4LHV2_CHRVL|nr:Ferric enterobactin transport system permease protein fepG [Chromobacterium violaceum]